MFQATPEAARERNRRAPLVRLNRWHIGRSGAAFKPKRAESQHPTASRGAASNDRDRPYRVEVGGKIFEGSDTRALLRLAVKARRAQRSGR